MNKVFDLYYSTGQIPEGSKITSVCETPLGYFYPDMLTTELVWAVRVDNIYYLIEERDVVKYMNMRK